MDNYAFAVKLAKYSSNSKAVNSDLCFSPTSIGLVLAMCQCGTVGEAKTKISQLIFDDPYPEEPKISQWIHGILTLGSESSKNDEFYELKFANRIYIDAKFSLKQEFVGRIFEQFRSNVVNTDFSKNVAQTAHEINAWVEEKVSFEKLIYLMNKQAREDEFWAAVEQRLISRCIMGYTPLDLWEVMASFRKLFDQLLLLLLLEEFKILGSSQMTNNRIKNLLYKDQLTTKTSILLVNALHFKGRWFDEFQIENTSKQNFHSSPDCTVKIDTMSMQSVKMYNENDQVQLVKLNYLSSTAVFEMAIMLPKEKFGLKKVVDQLDGSTLRRWISEGEKKEVNIQIPKFKIEQSFNLNECLQNLGLAALFTEGADFSAMVNDGSKVKISDVIHKAFIEVNEKGTEAAAATTVSEVFYKMFISNEEAKVFIADHPFLFVLLAGHSNILFIGQFCGGGHDDDVIS